MTPEEIKREMYLCGLSPVVVIDDAEDAVPLAKALLAGGVWIMEITFRTKAAAEAIRKVASEVPEMVVGAGTVINEQLAREAIDAGAKFIVTPGYSQEVVDYAKAHDTAIMPGTSTMTEIMYAINSGCDTVKVFPAERFGGLGYLKDIHSVFPDLKFIPSGGINLSNFAPYAQCPYVAATTGSWLAPKKLVADKKFDQITEVVKETVRQMHDFRLIHVGINNENAEDAKAAAESLSAIVAEPVTEFESAFFVGSMADIIKYTLPNEHGHIAIQVNNIDRAVRYFEDRGYHFTDTSYDDKHEIVSIWFDPKEVNIGGFAVHLRRR